jgi:hypothetical protein
MSKRSLGFGFRSSRGTTTTNPLGGSTHRLSAATCIASFPSRAERRSKLPSKASPFGDRARCSSAAKHRKSPPAYRRAHEWPSRDVQVHLFSMDHVQTSSRRYPRLLCVDPSLDSIRLEGSPSSSSAPCARSQWELGRRRRQDRRRPGSIATDRCQLAKGVCGAILFCAMMASARARFSSRRWLVKTRK